MIHCVQVSVLLCANKWISQSKQYEVINSEAVSATAGLSCDQLGDLINNDSPETKTTSEMRTHPLHCCLCCFPGAPRPHRISVSASPLVEHNLLFSHLHNDQSFCSLRLWWKYFPGILNPVSNMAPLITLSYSQAGVNIDTVLSDASVRCATLS